jgi:hypothetical protein
LHQWSVISRKVDGDTALGGTGRGGARRLLGEFGDGDGGQLQRNAPGLKVAQQQQVTDEADEPVRVSLDDGEELGAVRSEGLGFRFSAAR